MSVLTLVHAAAKTHLCATYQWPEGRTLRALEIALELSPAPVARPTDAGIVTITHAGGSQYTIEDRHRPQEGN